MKKAAIIMGSDSDLSALQGAIDTLKALEIPFAVRVISAHRTPEAAAQFARSAKDEGYGVIIAAAGKAAHLAGAMAANTILPVVGIPMKSSTLDGLDALLSTVQMPRGERGAAGGADHRPVRRGALHPAGRVPRGADCEGAGKGRAHLRGIQPPVTDKTTDR